MEGTGGVCLWVRDGSVRFQAAARWLREDETRTRPWLPLVRYLAARSLLAAMERASRSRQPLLADREAQVMQRLGNEADKQIAAALGLSAHGVRYHQRNLFAKLEVGNRAGAARRARELGLLSSDL